MTKPQTRGSAQQASASGNPGSRDAQAALHAPRTSGTAAAPAKRQPSRVSTQRSMLHIGTGCIGHRACRKVWEAPGADRDLVARVDMLNFRRPK